MSIFDLFFSASQYKWLERDLAKVDRDVTPWLVVSWHPPWYTSYKAHYREAECMRVAMEHLLYSNGVDIVFNGHVSTTMSDLITAESIRLLINSPSFTTEEQLCYY